MVEKNNHKLRKPLDIELKRIVENAPLKGTVSLLISVEVIKKVDAERGEGKPFKTRGACAEYYLRKGFEAEGVQIQ